MIISALLLDNARQNEYNVYARYKEYKIGGSYMKKIISLTMVLIMSLCSLCGCGNTTDPTGEYENVGIDTLSVLVMFASLDFKRPVSIKIDAGDEDYTFTDVSYKGTAKIEEELLVFNREESVSTTEKLKELNNRALEENPHLRRDAYFMYEDYLISENSSLAVEYGTLPEKDFADFGVEYAFDYCPFTMDFFDDGRCEFEGVNALEKEVFAEGKYEIDGQIINITLKKYKEEDGEIKSGNASFALFVAEGKIYDKVHKKIN